MEAKIDMPITCMGVINNVNQIQVSIIFSCQDFALHLSMKDIFIFLAVVFFTHLVLYYKQISWYILLTILLKWKKTIPLIYEQENNTIWISKSNEYSDC